MHRGSSPEFPISGFAAGLHPPFPLKVGLTFRLVHYHCILFLSWNKSVKISDLCQFELCFLRNLGQFMRSLIRSMTPKNIKG